MPEDDRERRRREREQKHKMLLLLLGFACLIQFLMSLRASHDLVARWSESSEEDSRRFDRQVRDEAVARPRVAAPPAGAGGK